MKKYEVTFTLFKDGSRECNYWVRSHTDEEMKNIKKTKLKRISEEALLEIQECTTEQVQAVLSKHI